MRDVEVIEKDVNMKQCNWNEHYSQLAVQAFIDAKTNKCHKFTAKKPKKKLNTRKMGQKFVNEAKAIYTENGWFTWSPGNRAVFLPGIHKVVSQSQDIFECADIICAKSDEKIHLVQVTSATKGAETSLAKKRRDKFDVLPFNMEHVVLVVMARVRGGGWRCWRKDTLGWAEVTVTSAGR